LPLDVWTTCYNARIFFNPENNWLTEISESLCLVYGEGEQGIPMKPQKMLLKAYIKLFSRVGRIDPRWEGYVLARRATTEAEREEALLEISKARYEESKRISLNEYFKIDLRERTFLRLDQIMEEHR
jgi:hypothetical protein